MTLLGYSPISYKFSRACSRGLRPGRPVHYSHVSHSLLGAGLQAGIAALLRVLH
jgi:hypothetical protein